MTREKPEYQYGRLGLSIHGGVLFYPKVRVLKNGLRRVVGKKLQVNEDALSFLSAAMHLAEQEGIRITAKVHFPKKPKPPRSKR